MRDARSVSSGGRHRQPFGLHAGGPEHGARREALRTDRDPFRIDRIDLGVRAHFDADLGEVAARALGEVVRKRREHARRRLEQHDARLRRIDPPEIPLHRGAADVGNRAGQLDAGRPAADDDEGQIGALCAGIALVLGALEGDQHAAPHLRRLLERLQPRREFLPLGMAEVAVASAARENQIVERDFVAFAGHDLLLEIDAVNVAEMNLDIRRAPELHADRHGDVGRVEARGRDLVEQRLEQVMVAVIDEDDAKALVIGEGLRCFQTREARADDDRDLGVIHRRSEDQEKRSPKLSNSYSSDLPANSYDTRSILIDLITTGFTGLSFSPVGTLPIAISVSVPSTSSPNTLCRSLR